MRNVVLFALLLAIPGVAAGQVADTIYLGGEIITVNDAQPTAQAIAGEDGKFLAVGARADVFKTQGDGSRLVDLIQGTPIQ